MSILINLRKLIPAASKKNCQWVDTRNFLDAKISDNKVHDFKVRHGQPSNALAQVTFDICILSLPVKLPIINTLRNSFKGSLNVTRLIMGLNY